MRNELIDHLLKWQKELYFLNHVFISGLAAFSSSRQQAVKNFKIGFFPLSDPHLTLKGFHNRKSFSKLLLCKKLF
jgi:hypothetical protein